jgi:hypothetical protein
MREDICRNNHKGNPESEQANFPAYQAHSKTSRQAAERIAPVLNALQARVYRYIMDNGGSTDEAGYTALDMSPSTYRPRRIELVNMGMVKDSGRTDKTASNRNAVVWVISLPPVANKPLHQAEQLELLCK